MTDSPDPLFEELKRLRQGRGVHRPDLDAHVGPHVRELCGVEAGDGPGVIRDKIIRKVNELTIGFPDDLRLAVETALGMNRAVQQRFLNERIAWLAARQERDNRTITRQVDNAMRLMCQTGTKRVPEPPKSGEAWHVRKFDAILRLDGTTPVSHELRTIVADQDGVDRIQWSISLPKAADDTPTDLDVEVLRGVVLDRRTKVSARRYVLDLKLPTSLDAGETHDFGLEVRIPHGQPMRPTYVFWPERRCEWFHLVVRFAADRIPKDVWRVSGAFHRDIDDIEPGPSLLTVDGIGEVEAIFDDLRADRGYGIQWRF